ncbi:P-loop containing nucleoside triphosphate hydrolase protein [Phlegmacium glaucopus]|nr:P-loop containing nucleoside triphosphate hydrolase protein [Phlegmacium glaucopus]
MIPEDRRLVSEAFWEEFSEKERAIGYRACLLLWVLSKSMKVPREFQIRGTIATLSNRDSLLDVGTNAGKTLCIVLPCLVSPDTLAVVFSPLKHLQAVQVLTFEEYGVKAIAINEDTPNDSDLWKNIQKGAYNMLIVQPEQLCVMHGHKPRLACLIDEDHKFTKLIRHLHIDEAHFIHTAGLGHYGLPAFRPAWGRLGEFRIKIGRDVPTQVLSGTQPEHIKATIIKSLLFNEDTFLSIKLTSNRPNIVYATHPIVGVLSNMQNLDFLIPVPYPAGWIMPKTVVFHDNIDLATDGAAYHERRLPEELQQKDLVAHYHGGMSKEYLTQVYEDFRKADGKCRLLHAMEGASMGLDIPDIEIVIQYGISRDVPTTSQRGGRGGRGSKDALFLIMYEPWVDQIDLSEINFSADLDPDHPNAWLGLAMIKIIQLDEVCLRLLFAVYLKDQSFEGLSISSPGQQSLSLPKLYYGDDDEPDREEILPERKKRKAGIKVCATALRQPLISRITAWRFNTYTRDDLRSVRPPSFIIDDKGIKKLARLHPSNITSPAQVTAALNETPEWDIEWLKLIHKIIRAYDEELATLRKETAVAKKSQQKRARVAQDHAMFEEASKEVMRRHAGILGEIGNGLRCSARLRAGP